MNWDKIFITGIGTDVGKTVVSSIFVEALEADYWKPIQSGDLDNSDSQKIKDLISNKKSIIHPEQYRLTIPASPHYSAEKDGVEIRLNEFAIPQTENRIVVEGAGGLQVPINRKNTILDLIDFLSIPVVLVSRIYLGSINHTLLSLTELERRGVEVFGLVFVGDNPASETIIMEMSGVKCLLKVEEHLEINQSLISDYAKVLRSTL